MANLRSGKATMEPKKSSRSTKEVKPNLPKKAKVTKKESTKSAQSKKANKPKKKDGFAKPHLSNKLESQPLAEPTDQANQEPNRLYTLVLSLPVEIRLEIYSNCSTFSLLQLSHASSHFYTEINNYPNIIKNTEGYYTQHENALGGRIITFEEYARISVGHKLNVNMVYTLTDDEEWECFKKAHCESLEYHQIKRAACFVCWEIFHKYEFMVFRRDPEEICYICEECNDMPSHGLRVGPGYFEDQPGDYDSEMEDDPDRIMVTTILDLPVELRLEIYPRCSSAFTLLQLSHSNATFYREINAYPKIFRTSFGYWKGPGSDIGSIDFEGYVNTHKDCNLNINLIARIRRGNRFGMGLELSLFFTIYGFGGYDNITAFGGRLARTPCFMCGLMYWNFDLVPDYATCIEDVPGVILLICEECQVQRRESFIPESPDHWYGHDSGCSESGDCSESEGGQLAEESDGEASEGSYDDESEKGNEAVGSLEVDASSSEEE
ncbi:hypothetical protein BJ508DRAFT_326600 [Ascobolus immersus RN42]|uniref:F-box domain-containing protein n=1 Tax=Ascobolus immersus RN42 TaxID=1160509 RepID=A0A3N4I532_ASCIM|nr:hypothetical protein BJ508DRAFT_326600 [Ascobolus immersus RN42]